MTTEPTKKAAIPTDLAMMLRPAQNGGWIIESVRENHMMPSLLGAFTTPADMLAALQEAFFPRRPDEEIDRMMELFKMVSPPPFVTTMMRDAEEAVDKATGIEREKP